VKADERSRTSQAANSEDEVKVKDVNMLEAGQNVSGAELMQIRVENIKNNQEKGANFTSLLLCHGKRIRVIKRLYYYLTVSLCQSFVLFVSKLFV